MSSKYTLDELCYKITDGSHSSPKAEPDGKYMFSVKDMNNFGFNYENAKTISINDFEKLVKQGCKPEINDVLIAKDGSVMKHIFSVKEDIDAVLLSSIAILKPKIDIINPQYFVYELLNPSMYNYILNNFKSGTGVPRIVLKDFKKIEITIPPLPIQKKIAHILSTLDDKIELNRKMNQTLESMASAIFKSWFVDFDPVHAKANCTDEAEFENIAKELGISKEILDLFPSEFIESEIGMIPKGWEVSKLGNILLLLESGSRPKGGIDPTLKDGFASIGAESINGIGNFNFQSTKYITSEFFNSLKRGIVSDYDVLVYKDGAYIGKKAMFGNGFPFSNYAINEHVFILRSNDLANQFFLYFLLEQDKLALLNTNSAQPGLNQESMKNYQIILPDIKIITAFEKIVKNLVDKILVNSMEIKTLEKTRDTLLPKLLSGEIDVSELEIL